MLLLRVFLACLIVVSTFVITGLNTNSYALQLESAGVAGLWHFDEGSGDVVKDASPNRNDGVVHDAKWMDGRLGKALEFAGTNDSFVEIPDSESLDITDAITIEVWVYPLSFEKRTAWGRIVTKQWDPWGIKPHMVYGIFFVAGKPIGAIISTEGGNENRLTTTAELSPEEWTHIAVTYDGEEMKLYLNGDLQKSADAKGKIDTNDIPLTIGRNFKAVEPVHGIIDEVAIMNRALTESEVKKSMTGLSAGVEASGSLVVTWGEIKDIY